MSAMDEWQKRMKAEKEAERQKKNESADMLRGYRGGDAEEAKKLKAAREEERRKKDEAQKALQEYKGNDMEELKKLKAQREEEMKRKLDAQAMLHDYKSKELGNTGTKRDAHITHQNNMPTPVNANGSSREEDELLSTISVSERTAWLSNMAAKSDSVPLRSNLNNDTSNNSSTFTNIADAETVELQEIETPTILTNEVTVEPNDPSLLSSQRPETTETDLNASTTPTISQESMVENQVNVNSVISPESDAEAIVSESLEQDGTHLTGSESIVENDDFPCEEGKKIENYSPVAEKQIDPDTKAATLEDCVAEPSVRIDEFACEEEKKMDTHTPISEKEIDPYRLDVLFSFGLVTVNADPVLDSYMNAVEEVVIKAIVDDSDLRAKVAYDKNHKPFVKSTMWDANFKSRSGRPDVKRLVVTASVPVFLQKNNSGDSVRTREGVVEALSAAIQTGSFLAIARGK